MEIKSLQLIEGAKKADGLTVIIDVFRAFSTACYVFDNNARKIIPVGKLETAYKLKEDNEELILMGEREGKTLPGFDYGNSPALIQDVDFRNKIVVHTTSAGTQGIVNARGADEIITGSFVNAKAVVEYILKRNPAKVSLVAMGNAGIDPAEEDILCAEYIKHLLEDSKPGICSRDNELLERILMNSEGLTQSLKDNLLDSLNQGNKAAIFKSAIIQKILRYSTGERFFDSANRSWSPPEDFEMCLRFSIFNFVLRAEKFSEDELIEEGLMQKGFQEEGITEREYFKGLFYLNKLKNTI
ncbi:MAG: 2-phosphosulfolactate phosphatase [Halanaerobiales bacterium]